MHFFEKNACQKAGICYNIEMQEKYSSTLTRAWPYFYDLMAILPKRQEPSFLRPPGSAANAFPINGVYKPLNAMHSLFRRAAHGFGDLLRDEQGLPVAPGNFSEQWAQYSNAESITLYFRDRSGAVIPVELKNEKFRLGFGNYRLAQLFLGVGQAADQLLGSGANGDRIRDALGTEATLASSIVDIQLYLYSALCQSVGQERAKTLMEPLDVNPLVFERLRQEMENALGVEKIVFPLMRANRQVTYPGIGDTHDNLKGLTHEAQWNKAIVLHASPHCQDTQMAAALIKLAADYLHVDIHPQIALIAEPPAEGGEKSHVWLGNFLRSQPVVSAIKALKTAAATLPDGPEGGRAKCKEALQSIFAILERSRERTQEVDLAAHRIRSA